MDYLNINRNLWNNKTKVHFDSDFYDNKSFIEGRNSLNSIELELLGDISGKNILHLQCHFGQDSISLSRMGAKVTGIDFSDKAIEKAKELAQTTHTSAKFICCDLYSLKEHLDEKFDMVFTSYGTIGWLPDLSKWASIIKHFLKPKGKFIMADFHPMIWMFNDKFSKFSYSYFNKKAIIEQEEGTYTNPEAPLNDTSIGWNHDLSEILNALIQNGLVINKFNEYDYSPYNCFNNTVEIETNKFQIKSLEGILPMTYSILTINQQCK